VRSLVANLVAKAAAQPAAPAYIDAAGALSYAELLERVKAAAAALWERGARADDVVALTLEEEAARRGLILFYAASWLGAAILPLYPEVPAADRQPLLQRYGARRCFAAADLDPGEAQRAPPRGDQRDRACLYHFSSGTSGEPKALCFTHGQFAAMIAAGAAADGWSREDRLVTGRPWPSKVAMRYAARLHVAGGALVQARFPRSRVELARLMRESGVTGICGSPAAMRALLESAPPAEPLPPLRVLRVSGAPARRDELLALRREITPNVYFSYGSTEVGVIASLRPHEPVADPVAMRIVTDGLEAQAVDEHDAPLPAGAVGRLRYRAPWMPQGYVGNPAASAERYRDGWVYPGDLGAIDAERRITLRGREDEVINYCGVKILPAEIEPVLLAHPSVAEAAVIGVPSAKNGAEPVAFVVPRGELDAADLIRFCSERFGDLRCPRHFVWLKSLPRNAAGKVVRERLLALFAKASARESVPPPAEPAG
jgi:acyl-coenzyme A synthetase/AMP-(fatty) acid ligase